jgi:hypothetical protein
VVAGAFQITFRVKMHANDVFSFFKNHFWHQHIKTIQNIQTILNFSKKKNFKFFGNAAAAAFPNMLEEGRKPLRISPRSLDFAAAREPTRRQWRRAWGDVPPLLHSSWGPPLQFQDFLGTFFFFFVILHVWICI